MIFLGGISWPSKYLMYFGASDIGATGVGTTADFRFRDSIYGSKRTVGLVWCSNESPYGLLENPTYLFAK